MDNRIIVAVIVGVAMVTSVYIYNENTPLNQCLNNPELKKNRPTDLMTFCLAITTRTSNQ